MKRLPVLLLAAAVILAPAMASAAIIDIASGTMNVANGQLQTDPVPTNWANASLLWDVNFDNSDNHYIYSYTFNNGTTSSAISHAVIQVSGNFTDNDDLAGSTPGGDVDTYSSANGNPGMPFAITGIKWNTTGDPLSATWIIETLRAPVWGNFYAKNGGGNGADAVYAFNSGFDDSPKPACYGGLFFTYATCSGFALTPDTVELPPDNPGGSVVPEPATLTLLGLGLFGVAGARRRRMARSK